ncbi:MAG: aminoglycoside phosphotransferase family protein [Actinomycetota bacterium]|nr:aminoglycoside phosphotransferase family protein [Actinomycetota bacterium]
MAHHDAEEISLFVEGNGTAPSGASRRGGTVMRRSGPWSTGVLSLLRHYEAVGLVGVPRVIGTGFSFDGRETLTYLPGTSAHPQAWADAALPTIGDLLRRIHQAGHGFSPAEPPRWRPWFGRQLTGSRRAERVGFADKLIEFAVRAARAEAVEHQVSAGTTAAVNDDGYPVLWAITWRARSAAWMTDHRSMLEQAIA